MKKVLGNIGVILVCIGILYLIYAFALPEYPKSIITGIVQPKINATASTRIEAIKNEQCKDVDGLPYSQIFANVKGSSWIYVTPEKSSDGAEHVIFYGKDASINLKDWPDYNGSLMYTSTGIKMDFIIRGSGYELVPYVDDFKNGLVLYDGKHEDANKQIKKDVLNQIYSGMRKDQQLIKKRTLLVGVILDS